MKLDLLASYLSEEKPMRAGKGAGQLSLHRILEPPSSTCLPLPEADLHLGRLHDGDIPVTVGNIFSFTRPRDRATGGAGEPFMNMGIDCLGYCLPLGDSE